MTHPAPSPKALPWLLERSGPGVRYLALRDLEVRPPQDAELLSARRAAHRRGPIAEILGRMHPDGYWERPGPGYNPKYRSSVWALVLLAQLGARVEEDRRLAQAGAYILDHAMTAQGQFSATGPPSGTLDCLQGNLCWALTALGCRDARLSQAYDWMARTVTGEGIAPASDRTALRRYYAGKCGPGFACGANNRLPCAWGAAKVLLAFSVRPARERSAVVRRAIRQGADFLLAQDPTQAPYPNGYSARPSRNWWKFGFPLFYVTDLLQVAEALVGLGLGQDRRLGPLLDYIRGRQDAQGRWTLDYDYAGKTIGDFGQKKQPNPWVTLRALRVLQAAG